MDWRPDPPQRRPEADVPPPPMPDPLRAFLYAQAAQGIKFDAKNSRFLYRVDRDHWKRAFGLTCMLRHAFWPDYDRGDPQLVLAISRVRDAHRKRTQRQPRSRGGRGYTTAEVEKMAKAPPRDPVHGKERGALVHRQVHAWAMDRFQKTHTFEAFVGGRPHRWTQAVIDWLGQTMSVDVRYGEFMIYHPAVPVATSVDLVGWSPRFRAVVLIELKTGSPWDAEMGTGVMRGAAARQLALSNAPLNQALVQLAVTHAIVSQRYRVPRVVGLLVWVNDVRGVQGRWLTKAMAMGGKRMLGELRAHLAARGGRPWAEPTARRPCKDTRWDG